MTNLNTIYIVFLGIILTLSISAGSNKYDISQEQSDQLYLIVEEKTEELLKLEQTQEVVSQKLQTLMQKNDWTQDQAIAFEALKHHATSIKIVKQSVLEDRWQNWQSKKNQIRQLIYRTNQRL